MTPIQTESGSVTGNQSIIEEACEFANREIRPFAATFEQEERLPRELIDKMADRGYLAACFPRAYGGLDFDAVDYGLLTEEIGKACSSTRALLTVHTSLVGETLLRWGTDAQKKDILPAMAAGRKIAAFALSEPDVGSDARNVKTSYRRDNGNYIINGRKKWITLGDIADIFLVIAANEADVTAFLVERTMPGLTTRPVKGLLAGKAAHIAEIEFADVEVPAECIVGAEGSGFTYIVNSALDSGRYSVAWGGLAIAQEALEAMVTYSRERRQFGQPIYQFQLIQEMIGNAVTSLHAARALCLHAGRLRKERHHDAIMETTIAKYFTSLIANRVASDAVQVHGGNGCWNKYPVERLFREARILEIIEGTSQIQQGIIAKFGLRRYHIKNKLPS